MAGRRLRPFFSYFGAKWKLAPKYPAPRYDTIVEPFAGSAQYACLYPDRRIFLCERDPIIAGIWQYLIRAPEDEILRLPDFAPGQTIDDLKLTQEQAHLIGMWLQGATSSPRKTPSKWATQSGRGGRSDFWGRKVREMIASQLNAIRHWRIANRSYEDLPISEQQATWYVDPPYQVQGKHYKHGAKGIDFSHLGSWCQSLPGQVIVCENSGADWLPFRDFSDIAYRTGGGRRNKEVVWLSDEHR